jgi:hypothetical protein
MQERRGICWSWSTTVGHIAVAGDLLRGEFDLSDGSRALIGCDFARAGKYRNGAERWWCRSHQAYWGVKADVAAFDPARPRACSAAAQPLECALDPLVIDMAGLARVRVAADSKPGLRVRAEPLAPFAAVIDARVPALALVGLPPVFGASDIVQVNVTPPAVAALMAARREPRTLGCIDCARCGHPHLDLGSFAINEHRRHYCGNCGNDSTHSGAPIVSNPLHRLDEYLGGRLAFE